MIKNIIFDWSGTLVDDLPAVWQATNYVMRQAGIPELTLDQFRSEFRLPFADFYERCLPHVSMAQLEEWFHGHFSQVEQSVVELPHARDFLLFCKQRGIRTFVLSTVQQEYYAAQAQRMGFHHLVERPYLRVWDKRKKIREILAENGLDASETLFIGDMAHDIETARHGEIHSCGVLTGYNRLEQLRAAEPDLVVEHLAELRQILEQGAFEIGGEADKDGGSESRRPVVTVGALIFNTRNEVLMLRTHKWSDLWGIPGGKIRYGEGSEEALRREIREETNLEISEIHFALVQDCIYSKEFYRKEHFVLLNYTCRCADDGDVRLNKEAEEFRWVTIEEAKTLPLNQPTLRLLLAVEKDIGSKAHG